MKSPYDYYITPEECKRAARNRICKSTLEYRIPDAMWNRKIAITKAPQKKRNGVMENKQKKSS